MTDLKVGAVIPAGTLVLITSGRYSSFGVEGLFRAMVDTTVPGRTREGRLQIDTARLATLLEEVSYHEAWADND